MKAVVSRRRSVPQGTARFASTSLPSRRRRTCNASASYSTTGSCASTSRGTTCSRTQPKRYRRSPTSTSRASSASKSPRAWSPSGLHASRDVVLRHRRAPPRSVTGGHRIQDLVAALVVVLRLEDDDHERLLGLGVMEGDELGRRESLRGLTALHLPVHLIHPVLAHAFERHNSCERHLSLLVD